MKAETEDILTRDKRPWTTGANSLTGDKRPWTTETNSLTGDKRPWTTEDQQSNQRQKTMDNRSPTGDTKRRIKQKTNIQSATENT